MKKKGLMTLFATAMVLGVIPVTPAFAAYNYTPVEGTTTTFNKYLIMDAGDHVPNATFGFTAAPGTARSANTSDNSVMQVLPGIGNPTITNAVFSPADDEDTLTAAGNNIDVARAASARADGLTAETGVELEAGEKYALHEVTVNFAGITFDEPGIYRYVITETASTEHENAGIMHDNDTDRILDVYVTDDNGTLVVSSYVLHTSDADVVINTTMGSADVATAGAALTDKTDGFTNEYNSKDLVFKKEVSGNQASRDKWFEFTATVTDVNDNDKFTVSLADDQNEYTTDGNADAKSGTTTATRESNKNKDNVTLVTGADLKRGVKFYLQHGQSIAIRGLAPNANYTITEDEEDYKKTPSVVEDYTDATTGVMGTIAGTNKAVKTSFKNDRNGVVPTNAIVSILPYMAIAVLGILGLAVTGRKKKEV